MIPTAKGSRIQGFKGIRVQVNPVRKVRALTLPSKRS